MDNVRTISVENYFVCLFQNLMMRSTLEMAKLIEGRRLALWSNSTSPRYLVGWLVCWLVWGLILGSSGEGYGSGRK